MLETKPRTYSKVGVQIPRVLLPARHVDLNRWAVVAVDQYTSQPEYWRQVEALVGESPSALNLVLPEAWLDQPGEAGRIERIHRAMHAYVADGTLVSREGMVYVERRTEGRTRRGLVVSLDLEAFDYRPGASTLVRASEGTILERVPPRMKVRRGATLELPHILVLVDDPQDGVLGPLQHAKGSLEPLYDFELMMAGGSVAGWLVADPALEAGVMAALENLADPHTFASRYGVDPATPVMLYAMGDGNHSLAAAKAVWEEMKPRVGMEHPARYALVELVNLHDPGLVFESIHRALFGLQASPLAALRSVFGARLSFQPAAGCEEMHALVRSEPEDCQAIGVTWEHNFGVIEIADPPGKLAVATLQPALDRLVSVGQAQRIDYIHGDCTLCRVTGQPGAAGFFLPRPEKNRLFQSILQDGALPRKTFSMGEANEKRFYLEARKIA